jgi:uncharacterized membrane protein YfcA
MIESIILFFIVLFGSLITGLSGFGGGSIVLAGMMVIYPPHVAIPLHGLTQFLANLGRVLLFYKGIRWRVVAYYSLLILPASWIGVRLFDYLNPHILKIFVGCFIIYSIFPRRISLQNEPSLGMFAILGGISGFLSVFVGSIGPMVTPYFNRVKSTREENLSTKSAGQMILQFSKLVAFSGVGGFSLFQNSQFLGIIFFGTLAGIIFSHLISKKISDEIFNLILNILLVIVSLKILYEGLLGIIS